jgi:lipid-A-disaccharide synthase
MGVVEVLPHLPRLRRRLLETAALARKLQPDVLVTIDSPGFNFRLCRLLRDCSVPFVHYVAPTVWAWRPGRARKVARFLDHLLALLPFEPPYFERHGLPCSYVGHPILEAPLHSTRQPPDSRPDPAAPFLCVLPGSRRGEVERLLPVFGETVARLATHRPGLRVAIPTVENVARQVREAVAGWPVATTVAEDAEAKRAIFATADVALAASGTVILELAMAGVPTVAAYRGNALTWLVVAPMINIRFATLVNLLLDRPAIPEFLQARCRPDLLELALATLLTDEDARNEQRHAFAEALARLAIEGKPSERAAAIVLQAVGEKRAGRPPRRFGR